MQQINLFQAGLRKKQNHFAPAQLAQYAGIVATVLVIISSVQGWLYYRAVSRVSELKASQQQLLAEVQKISNELSASSDDSQLKASISKKEQEQANKQNVLQALSGKQFGNVKGFADQFVGLSRQHIEGVWLTGLHIHSGGTRMNLTGSTYAPENVPKYLQNLSQEADFRGLEFKTFLMERKDKSSLVNFSIRSQENKPKS